MVRFFAAVVFSFSCVLGSSLAVELPQYALEKHLGVATCSSSNCHGATIVQNPGNVRQDEYLTWLFHDSHAQAFNTLRSDASFEMAKKLGLGDPTQADVCLDCHADNVPMERRGEKFLITDGVGCESCHGGAENWISSHTVKPYSLARNLADGMYPTASLVERTELCVSCHVGTGQKLANHEIMGAGHPRLGFSLDVFSAVQPEHYDIDADYNERKHDDAPDARLLSGISVQAQQVAKNMNHYLRDAANKPHPELALFDCYACHRPIVDLNWQPKASKANLSPGTIRLDDSVFILLANLVGGLDQSLQNKILVRVKALHVASQRSLGDVNREAGRLHTLTESALRVVQSSHLDVQARERMVSNLVALARRNESRDYIVAEQIVMALDSLSQVLPGNTELAQLVESAYSVLADDEAYRPRDLVRIMSKYQN
ncbi:MAG: multiheme c-type cytochrome [Pseudomonadota bacterium]